MFKVRLDVYCIVVFLGIAFLSGMACRNSAFEMIKEIGTVSRYFPKHYKAPPKWMRRFFQIRQRVIPRYLYFRFLLSLFYLILGPLNTVIFIATGCDKLIARILIVSHSCLIIVNEIFFIIMSLLYKRK